MSCFFGLPGDISGDDLPDIFPSPFSVNPHRLAVIAAQQLKLWLEQTPDLTERDAGKMFGVLVVRTQAGRIGYLRGFSGMLAESWEVEGFVPQVFDQKARDAFLHEGEATLKALTDQIKAMETHPDYLELTRMLSNTLKKSAVAMAACRKEHAEKKEKRRTLRLFYSGIADEAERSRNLQMLSWQSQQDKRERKALLDRDRKRIARLEQAVRAWEARIDALQGERKALSQTLHRQVFETYQLENALGEKQKLTEFFTTDLPPGGTGDCAGPKLIHYAVKNRLTPVAMAEFWWGPSPPGGGRHHGQFYPSCRGKCKPILPFMLKGIPRQSHPTPFLVPENNALDIVYEDEHLLLVNKPAGLLSVPGIEIKDSVHQRLQRRYPEATGPLLVHRLDLATSGLLLAAKTAEIHKLLQRQFIERRVQKCYVAELEGDVPDDSGVIDLPLRVDLDDRPRQIVCHRWGKSAQTRWEVVSRQQGRTRVHFYPVTGRTHQLRVHAAHPDGLNLPIVGDELYGRGAERLLLHAYQLTFTHPAAGDVRMFTVEPPF